MFNEIALARYDLLLAEAGRNNIKLILALSNWWDEQGGVRLNAPACALNPFACCHEQQWPDPCAVKLKSHSGGQKCRGQPVSVIATACNRPPDRHCVCPVGRGAPGHPLRPQESMWKQTFL